MTSPIRNPLTDPRVLMSREDIALRRLMSVAKSLILTGATGGGGSGSGGTLVITGGSAGSTFSGGDSVISGGSA